MNLFFVILGVSLIVYAIFPWLVKDSELARTEPSLDDKVRTVLLVTCGLCGVALLYEGLYPAGSPTPLLPNIGMLL